MERLQYLVPILGNTRNNFVDVSTEAPFPVQIITGNGGTAVSSSNPLPIQNVSASPVDRSSTITTGGTAQVLLAANANRKGIEFFNNSVGSIWLNAVGTATAGGGSIEVRSGGYWSPPVVPVTAISVIGATTAQAFTCWEYA